MCIDVYERDVASNMFVITINPSVSSCLFTSLEDVASSFKEQEILFSTHTIFRINSVEINANHLWPVNLTLTNHDDQEFNN